MYIANTFFEHDDEKMVTYHDLKSDTADVVSILHFAELCCLKSDTADVVSNLIRQMLSQALCIDYGIRFVYSKVSLKEEIG